MLSDFRRRNQPIVFYNPSPSFAQTLRGVSSAADDFVIVHNDQDLHQFISCKRISKASPRCNAGTVVGWSVLP
jgi:hypothetical protein